VQNPSSAGTAANQCSSRNEKNPQRSHKTCRGPYLLRLRLSCVGCREGSRRHPGGRGRPVIDTTKTPCPFCGRTGPSKARLEGQRSFGRTWWRFYEWIIKTANPSDTLNFRIRITRAHIVIARRFAWHTRAGARSHRREPDAATFQAG